MAQDRIPAMVRRYRHLCLRQFVALLVLCVAALTVSAQKAPALGNRIVIAARSQIGLTRSYDPSYVQLSYPGGDVPMHTGVCSDVVVRALRQVGIDLQKEMHEDMAKNFAAYPQKYGLKKADKNIDHRRVPNLMTYFERHHISMHEKLKLEQTYLAGDIVAWDLGKGVLHVGIVSEKKAGQTPLIIHNIGNGVAEEDVLFKFKVIGHYRIDEDRKK
jgi:uncharacterized protein YijF (DUF1287 family)